MRAKHVDPGRAAVEAKRRRGGLLVWLIFHLTSEESAGESISPVRKPRVDTPSSRTNPTTLSEVFGKEHRCRTRAAVPPSPPSLPGGRCCSAAGDSGTGPAAPVRAVSNASHDRGAASALSWTGWRRVRHRTTSSACPSVALLL